MNDTIIVALITAGATVLAQIGIALNGARLSNYKIDELSQRVDKHNNLISRTYALEERQKVIEERMKVANHRIDDLENLSK